MLKTVAVNAVSLHKYIPSIRMIRDTIRSSGADAVVNFYELMTGLTCMFCRIDVPVVCIGHQYLSAIVISGCRIRSIREAGRLIFLRSLLVLEL